MENFKNKVVLVTGAANGIGKGIAEKFASAGAHTVIVDFDSTQGKATAEQLSQKYVKSIFVQADVSNSDAMLKVREETFKAFGRIESH